jgi:hypothetical protein
MNVILGDTFVCYLTTSQFSSGGKVDADSTPGVRVYEAETGTPIATGSFAKLDDAGTTGLYSYSLAMTTGNGVEAGKSYAFYKTATVDSVDAHAVETVHVLPVPALASDVTNIENSLTTITTNISDMQTDVTNIENFVCGDEWAAFLTKIIRNRMAKNGQIVTFYDDDAVTPLLTQTYVRTDSGFERGAAE